jgi:predicted metal-binding protein
VAGNSDAVLFVCTTCVVAGETRREGHAPSGQQLYEKIRDLDAGEGDVRVMPVVCLANCDQGCSAAASAPGKWSYVMGYLTPEQAPDLLAYGRAYAKSKLGVVLRSQRADSMRDSIVARIPSLALYENEAAE